MSSLEVESPVAETERLPNSLRLKVDLEFYEIYGLQGAEAVEWISGQYGAQLSDILSYDEEVKALAIKDEIHQAAILAKERLDEYFGYDIFGESKEES